MFDEIINVNNFLTDPKKYFRDYQDQRDHQEDLDQLVQLAILENQVHEVQGVNPESKEIRVKQDHKVRSVQWEGKVLE